MSSVDRSQLDPAEAQVKAVELHFTVDRDGRLDNVTSPTTDVPDAIVKNSIASMKRSRFAPRIENGAAVPTQDVVFVERVLIKASPESGAPSDSGAEKPADSKTPDPKAPAPAESPPADSAPPPAAR